ncbi:hypothetical protein B0H12DRAFT_1112945, partial [Mycena haematopus]
MGFTSFKLHVLTLALSLPFRYVATSPAPVPAEITLSVPAVFLPVSAPYQAVVLGVDSQGHTTYAVDQPFIDGTSTTPLTATLVEGAEYASYTFSLSTGNSGLFNIQLGFDCSLTAGNAICTGLDSNSQVATVTSSLQTFVLDVVSTAVPSSGGPASQSQSGGVPTSQPSTGPASQGGVPTSQSSASAQPTNKPSSSHRSVGSISGALVGVVLVAYWL